MAMPVEHRPDVAPAKAGDHHDAPESLDKLKDPVCGMAVTALSPHHLEHESKPYYFCSAGCRAKFAADPSACLAKAAAREAAGLLAWLLPYRFCLRMNGGTCRPDALPLACCCWLCQP